MVWSTNPTIGTMFGNFDLNVGMIPSKNLIANSHILCEGSAENFRLIIFIDLVAN